MRPTRSPLQTILSSLLISSLLGAPLGATPASPLGVVLQAHQAFLASAPAIAGASLFDGDRLSTGSMGHVRLRIRQSQLYLPANSSAAVGQMPKGFKATLQQGTLIFSSAGAKDIEVWASDARIRPQTTRPTFAQVTLVGSYELILTSQRGSLEIQVGDEIHAVPEGTSYRVLIEPEPGAGARQRQPTVTPGRARLILVVLIAIGVGTGIGIWRALVSPDSP